MTLEKLKGYDMIQGRNMTQGRVKAQGMRKGISLVEMLIAIVLFGTIGTISIIYYKNYYDVSFAAKKLRISVVVDQAQQLANGFDLYEIETGAAPATIQDMVEARILTARPIAQPSVSSSGWLLDSNFTISGTTALNDTVFIMELNSTLATTADDLDLCNILNNKANTSWSLEANVSTAAAQVTSSVAYTAGDGNVSDEREYFHCSTLDSGTTLDLVFVKLVNTF
ncbi:hypothetical protein JHD50_09185 [Sulfurimonas sp. MAG313]|nr:hypothetical protein [Sulfurimonas sp. MAG313]MDF1881471.1 hypothetical protein [Sulfurimonas sp. MAG313]